MPAVFSLRLGGDGAADGPKQFCRLPPPVRGSPYVLRFVITAGASASCSPVLLTNCPPEGHQFERTNFREIKFVIDGLADPFCDISVHRAGAYEYRVRYDGGEARTGYFLVDPRLVVPSDSIQGFGLPKPDSPAVTVIPLDGIAILSVIPKWMPTISKWPSFFKEFSDAGYNMVHFAPLNQRGISNSPYSIYDQLAFSDDLFDDPGLGEDQKELLLKETIDSIHANNKIISITDIVWNHTACNSSWLLEHPEAGYNLKTAPHLRPAYELDEAILQFSDDLETVYGKPTTISTEQELSDLVSTFMNKVFPEIKLWQFYVVDAVTVIATFREQWGAAKTAIAAGKPPPFDPDRFKNVNFASISQKERAQTLSREGLVDPKTYLRFSKTIDMSVAMSLIHKLSRDLGVSDTAMQVDHFVRLVDEVNLEFYQEFDGDVASIRDQIPNRARYLRLAEHGPRLGPISRHNPLVDTYFTRLPVNNITKDRHPDELCLASNGWIWNADPLVNFAGEGSKAYLRREVIAWGDCTKLRYGNGPQDNPWLWEHQLEYTRKMARIFHGLRIDNCHSTPIHVAQYLLDAARRINPDLYVFAELFTGSEEKDVLFVSKLGINSLIREAMNAWDPQELSRVVHRQGGSPVGSFTIPAEYYPYDILGHSINSVFYEPLDEESSVVVELRGSRPHSLLMDCTHDNETPHQKRTAEDSLPNAAVVAMAACAVGSVKGYDEIVPELLNVVTESRKYRLPDSFEGIIPAKSILNTLHAKMAREGYSEIHVNQEHDFISIHRVHPITHDGYLLIVRCAFRGANKSGPVHSPIILRNQAVHVLESATLSVQTSGGIGHASIPYVHDHGSDSETEELMPPSTPTQLYHAFNSEEFEQALERSRASIERRHSRKVLGYISGLPSTLEFSTVLSHITHAFVETVGDSGDIQTVISIDSQHFVPGSIVLYRTWVVGTGIEQDVAAAESASPSASPVGSQSPPNRRSQAHNGLTIETTKNPAGEIDVSTLTLDLAQLTTEPSEPAGAFERLWQLLGMNQHNAAIEMMVRFGYGVLGSSELWYTSQNSNWMPGLYEAVRNLSDRDINTVLFRAAPEEVDMTGDSVYDVPGHGALAYCGLQGIVSALLPAARDNDLGAALFQNLRQGPWLADYVVGRLTKLSKFLPGILPIRDWLQARLKLVTSLSQAFVPKYFAIVVVAAYQGVRYRALTLRSDSLSHRNLAYLRTSSLELFAENCVLTQFQLFSSVRSTGLFPVPYPLDVYGPTRIEIPKDQRHPSLAAGLPHFSTQHMRCWGRDIFIALRGMFLIPGNYAAARSHIIAFGSTLRHGLIPNLLDQGIRPRYNARDATWFWLRSVRDYCRYAPEGYAFLGTPVARRFIPKRRYTPGPDFCVAPDDPSVDPPDADTYIEPSDPRVYTHTCTIAHLCQEILERHARGISFREWNAGPGLDHAMRSEGFDIAISTPWATASPDRGFVHGGNRWNCGTWMDKMGDSQKAGTRGVPATPRDGSPVEIIGLLKGILHWLSGDVHVKGKEWWKWSGVKVSVNGQERPVEYAEWDALVGKSFETLFYIPLDPAEDKRHLIERPELVSRRGIYKDVLGSSIAYADYQLRPNACIAMVLAPEMFDPDHARHALTIIRETLAGPLGIKTLDPKDWAYRGVYDNGNDSADPTVAHGFNYHQGPEWVWVMGYFLRAYIHFFTKAPGHNPAATERELMWVQRQLLRHKKHICDTRTNPFAGLPELTNENGAFCYGSCPTQAWSTAVMVEVIQDLMQHRIC